MKTTLLSLTFISALFFSCGNAQEESKGKSQNPEEPNEETEVAEEEKPEGKVIHTDVDAFAEKIQEPCTILDVRTIAETDQGIIENAVLMDITKPDFAEKMKTLDKSKPVCVYCKAGGRSESAANMLAAEGYTVYNLAGGYDAWKAAGK